MNDSTLLDHIRGSLAAKHVPRFFETERGFQGALLGQLEQRIPKSVLLEGALIEQEYQKRLRQHGLPFVQTSSSMNSSTQTGTRRDR